MRKGEESKKKIIDAAEKLFARKGYANTSVQDVLDELKISKGGFYHYFDTKMELLAEVCRRRAEEWYAAGIAHVRGMRTGAVERLNAALRLMNTLDRESPALLGAMTEVGLAGEDAAVKSELRELTLGMLHPMVEEILDSGVQEKQFVVRRTGETARMLILLALDVNDLAVAQILANHHSPECAYDVLEMLDTYRESVETLVNAPYGSISLFDMSDMVGTLSRLVSSLEEKTRGRSEGR